MVTDEELNQCIAQLQDQYEQDELALSRARSKLYVHMPPREADRSQRYDVDLTSLNIDFSVAGKVTCSGPIQVIGTYDPAKQEFLWGWHNKHLSQECSHQFKQKAEQIPLLQPLLESKGLIGSSDLFEDITHFIAVRTGWLGAYPARSNNYTVFLAVRLSHYPGTPNYNPEDNRWCNFCGRFPDQVPHLVAAGLNAAVCTNCVEQFREIIDTNDGLSEESQEKLPTEADQLLGAPCLCCGNKPSKRVFDWTEATSICHSCLNEIADVLAREG